MQVEVFSQQNKKVGKLDVPESVFKVAWNPKLVHQVFVAQVVNRRSNLAHTKGRSEVRGGGKKPWRQKGTGRARAGSIRSPLWRGGGVTFGPTKKKSYEKKINKKMRRLALFSLLSKKLADNEVKIIETLNFPHNKTKEVEAVLQNFLGDDARRASTLFVPTSDNKDFFLASRNIVSARAVNPLSLNVHDCLSNKFLFIDKEAVNQIAEQRS